MTADFPQSSEQVLDLIAHAERSRKFVWTAGRVLIVGALCARWEGLNYGERKLALNRLTGFLEDLVDQGILQRRSERQSIGYGSEIGFDYVHSKRCNQRT